MISSGLPTSLPLRLDFWKKPIITLIEWYFSFEFLIIFDKISIMPAAFRSDFQQTSKSQYASLKKPTPWSMKTADLFTLYVPSQADATLNFLTCSICSSYMKKPTTLPCGHTFCYQCLENLQHLRSGSLPVNFKFSASLSDTTLISITCKKCFRTHRMHSLQDLAEDQSMCLLLNSLICERCDQLTIPNHLDTCYQCYKILCQNCHENHMLEHRDDEDLTSLSNSTAVQSERNVSKSEIKSTSVSTSPKTNVKGILNESFGFDQQVCEEKLCLESDENV